MNYKLLILSIAMGMFFTCKEFPLKPVINTIPCAKAAPGKCYEFTDTVWLDARESFDPDGDTLWYIWDPPGNYPMATVITFDSVYKFLPQKSGIFTFTLTVYDGKDYSSPVQTTDTILGEISEIPVAHAGNDSSYFFFDTVWLDASKSVDPDGDSLLYIWTPPNNYPMDIRIDTVPRFWFIPARTGVFTFTLTVFDGKNFSKPDQITDTIYGVDKVVSSDPDKFPTQKVYQTITEALDSAVSGDTIFIDRGHYIENITIATDSIFIFSIDREKTIIDGSNAQKSTAAITANISQVTMKGFTIINAGGNDHCGGIQCSSVTNVILAGNHIKGNSTDGIRLFDASNITITGNVVDSNKYNGIRSKNSSLKVTNNLFKNNGWVSLANPQQTNGAVALEGNTAGLYDVVISNNQFSKGNRHQVRIFCDIDALISNNTFRHADTVIYCRYTQNARINIVECTFDSVGVGIYCFGNSPLTLALQRNIFRNMNNHCILSEDASGLYFISENDSFTNAMTPLWCKGTRMFSVTGSFFSSPQKTVNQKSIDIQDSDSGKIAYCSIYNYAIGIIARNAPVVVRNNSFFDTDTADSDTGVYVIEGSKGYADVDTVSNIFTHIAVPVVYDTTYKNFD